MTPEITPLVLIGADRGTDTTPKTTPSATDAKPKTNPKREPGIAHGAVVLAEDANGTGWALDNGQIDEANTILGVAVDLDATTKTAKAMLCAALGESMLGDNLGSRGTTFQTRSFSQSDLKGQAKAFLTGGPSFQAGGAIKATKNNPTWSVGTIASKVEASDQGGDYYDKFADSADNILEAYGWDGSHSGSTGGSSSSPPHAKQFNYTIDKNETKWDGAVRLAGDVQWYFWVNGNYIHFDTGAAIIKQRPVKVLRRNDPDIVDLNFTWDARHIATEVTLTLICDPDDYHAGEVFLLQGFGPLSKGKYKGRWLIAEISGSRFSPTRDFTLALPMRQKKEPPHEMTSGGKRSGGGGEKIDNAISGSPIAGQKPHSSTHDTSGLAGYPAYDYMAPAGTPVVAPVDGKVFKLSGKDPKYGGSAGGPMGYSIYIQGDNHKKYYLTHLDKVEVKDNDKVDQGQQIAEVAKSGAGTWDNSATHVHMGVNG